MNKSVSIRDLSLSFGAVTVLKDLNLDIYDGEFLVLLGSSGCGKSTLLNCIAGLLEPTDGQIYIKDRNVTWEEPKDRGIGMVFQSYALYPQMTVEKNLSFGLQVADPSFGDRVAFSRCMISGQAAQEVEPNGKAAAEVTALFDWVVAHLHSRTRAPAQRKKKGEAA